MTARDGARIPVSLAYRKGFMKNGKAAMLQYAYGSYGLSMDPAYSPVNPSLMDRGMVYALAHIRGGQEMGRAWYDDGHLLHTRRIVSPTLSTSRVASWLRGMRRRTVSQPWGVRRVDC